MAIAAGKGAKAQKIGLEEQASRRSSAYPTARRRILRVGVTAATQGARGDCAASQPRVVAARSCAQPPRERSGADAPCSTTPPDSAAPPDP
jgi:hypothetical protein